jgi:hypothetical protein
MVRRFQTTRVLRGPFAEVDGHSAVPSEYRKLTRYQAWRALAGNTEAATVIANQEPAGC